MGFRDTRYLPFFVPGINYPFDFHGYAIMGYCVQYFVTVRDLDI